LSLRVHFEAEAEVEYLQALRWYERQRDGLGVEFLDEVDATIRRVLEAPFSGATVPRLPADPSVRRLATRRFPYHVVYLIADEELRILAVAHDRRRPGFWNARLG
jgi:plasmid stabilization system protein ParE